MESQRLTQLDFRVSAAVVFLFSSGGLMITSIFVPNYLRSSWLLVYIAVSVLTFLFGGVILWLGQLSGWGAVGIIVYADAAIVVSAFSQQDRSAGRLNAALLTLPCLFIAVFLTWRWLAGQAAVAGVCGSLILSLTADPISVIAIQSLIVLTSAACPAVIVVILRNQLNQALLQARELATTDPLTGLLNRRGMDERAVEVSARAGRAELPVGVLVADVDHFKKVNDRYGHTIGDHVLRQVAGAAKACVRTEDLVVRLGGEEIAVIGVIDPDRLDALAERLRESVQTVGRTWAVTVSIGMAWRQPVQDDEPIELLWTLIDSADDRMYEAKEAGRNQVRGRQATG